MERERARDEAAAWVVRLSEAPDPATRAAFETWRSAGVHNEIAWERAAAAWERLDRLAALRAPELAPAIAPPARYRSGRGRGWAAIAASLLLFLVAGAMGVLLSVAPSPAYATGVGERRLVVLTDGTRVELNTNSRIVVRYAAKARVVELDHGEAVFHVARDERPFDVAAGKVRFHAADAELAVRLDDERARVVVRRGRVVATGEGEAAAPLAALGPNFEATVGAAGAQVEPVAAAEIDRLLAWRQGGVAFDGETLAEAVDEFNRYNNRKIHLADARTSAIRVGGWFEASDVDGFAQALTRTFPVRASNDRNGDVLLSASEAD